jgi:hypothetical protein
MHDGRRAYSMMIMIMAASKKSVARDCVMAPSVTPLSPCTATGRGIKYTLSF